MTQKTSVHNGEPMVWVIGAIAKFTHAMSAKLQRAVETLAPVGFQDATGFHYGTKRTEHETR